jgi:hypothetical protein
MDYGRPMKPFFIEIPNSWAWADKFWGIFSQTISTYSGTVSPLAMFSTIQPLFLKKTKPNIYLRLKFGPKRIRVLAFLCP